MIFFIREPRFRESSIQWLILGGNVTIAYPEWVFFDQGHSKGTHWQIILRSLLVVLIKQELHAGTQVKQKYCSLISSVHTFQILLLLRYVWVFCSGWISFSWSYYTEGCICLHLYMVLLQSETLKMLCSGWVMAARKSFFFEIYAEDFSPSVDQIIMTG